MDTLGDMRAVGVALYVNCSHAACCRSALVNLDMLIEKLGRDHGAIHYDPVGISSARPAGKPVVTKGRSISR